MTVSESLEGLNCRFGTADGPCMNFWKLWLPAPYCVWQDRYSRLHHQGEALALVRHHRLFTHLLPYDYPDLTLSGEAGVAVLRTARAAADWPFRRPRW